MRVFVTPLSFFVYNSAHAVGFKLPEEVSDKGERGEDNE